MIDGLHFDVTSDELQVHLHARSRHHTERAAVYGKKIEEFEADEVEAMQYTQGDPIKQLKNKKSEHDIKASKFEFMASHVVHHETYRLEESEMTSIEMIAGRIFY